MGQHKTWQILRKNLRILPRLAYKGADKKFRLTPKKEILLEQIKKTRHNLSNKNSPPTTHINITITSIINWIHNKIWSITIKYMENTI